MEINDFYGVCVSYTAPSTCNAEKQWKRIIGNITGNKEMQHMEAIPEEREFDFLNTAQFSSKVGQRSLPSPPSQAIIIQSNTRICLDPPSSASFSVFSYIRNHRVFKWCCEMSNIRGSSLSHAQRRANYTYLNRVKTG